MTWGGVQFGWTSGQVLGPLLSGVTVLVGFVIWEWKIARIPIAPSKSSLEIHDRTQLSRLRLYSENVQSA